MILTYGWTVGYRKTRTKGSYILFSCLVRCSSFSLEAAVTTCFKVLKVAVTCEDRNVLRA
jgi:hypothetical protein